LFVQCFKAEIKALKQSNAQNPHSKEKKLSKELINFGNLLLYIRKVYWIWEHNFRTQQKRLSYLW